MKPLKFYSNMPTQREIAEALNLSEDYISKLISGKRTCVKQIDRINRYIDSCTRKERASYSYSFTDVE